MDLGFTPDGVLTVQLVLPEGRYDGDEARRAFYARAFADIDALPDVTTVGAAMVTPLTGNNWSVPLHRVHRPVAPGQRPPEVGWQLASQGYFRALRIPLRAGRLFEARDATGPPVVIVSEASPRAFSRGDTVGAAQPWRHGARSSALWPTSAAPLCLDYPRADLLFFLLSANIPQTTLFIRSTGDRWPCCLPCGPRSAGSSRTRLEETRTSADPEDRRP